MEIKDKKFYIDKKYLEQHYIDLKRSTPEIARIYGTTHNIIYNYLKEFNIPIRSSKEANRLAVYNKLKDVNYVNKEWLQHQYINLKRTSIEISNKCGVSDSTILFWLKRFNIAIRSRSEIAKLIWNKPGYKKKMIEIKTGKEYKKWDELSIEQKHYRMGRLLELPIICPICNNNFKNKKQTHLTNLFHTYLNDPLDWYYMCSKCHSNFHGIAGLQGRNKFKTKHYNGRVEYIPNFISNLQQLQTRTGREQLLKEVILNI